MSRRRGFRRRPLLLAVAGSVTLLVCGHAADARGQDYRLRLDTRAQAVSYRGVTLDSVLATDTVTGPTGGPVTRSGFAVRCAGADPYCRYFRPGPERRGGPLTTVADMSVWGLGVPGLSVRATARLAVDLGDADVWPGTEPAAQLLEGYADYANARVAAQLGRQTVATRLGMTGFDGARVTVRDAERGLDVTGYAGWGLARGAALPVTSPALDPLDDFQPRQRQLVAGAGAGWTASRFDVRLTYQREVDPRSSYFVSERAGVDAGIHVLPGWSLSGGADYDLAAGWWGSAEAALGYAPSRGRVAATLGARRYRPRLELWTIWGAFSPVPYRTIHGSLALAPLRGGFARLRLRARGERYWFDDADVATPLVRYETAGWRFGGGLSYTFSEAWVLDGGYRAEFGPGAASRGFEASVTYAPAGGPFAATLHGATLDRPLEFRFDESSVRLYGVDAEYRAATRLRLQLDASRYAEDRKRPDAAAFDWDQVRASARVVLLFGGGADLGSLPRAVRRTP